MKIRVLSAADVYAALPMPVAIEAMRQAFGQLSAGQVEMPPRSRLHTDEGVTLFMPAYLRASQDFTVKVVSVYNGNLEKNLAAVLGAVLVIDPHSGAPLALIEGASLTALRTGAGGGLATEVLARRTASVVGLFGASVQARVQLQAVLAVRAIQEVRVLSRSRATAEKFAAEVATWPNAPRVRCTANAQATVEGAHILIAATSSETPVLDGAHVAPGIHITGVGTHTASSREIDEATVRRVNKVVVDSYAAAQADAGDILLPSAPIYAELGEIINGHKAGRETDEEITFFKSVGLAAQDAAAAGAVLREAEARGLGTVVEL